MASPRPQRAGRRQRAGDRAQATCSPAEKHGGAQLSLQELMAPIAASAQLPALAVPRVLVSHPAWLWGEGQPPSRGPPALLPALGTGSGIQDRPRPPGMRQEGKGGSQGEAAGLYGNEQPGRDQSSFHARWRAIGIPSPPIPASSLARRGWAATGVGVGELSHGMRGHALRGAGARLIPPGQHPPPHQLQREPPTRSPQLQN